MKKTIRKRVRIKNKNTTVTFRISTDTRKWLEAYADKHTSGNLSKTFDKIISYLQGE